jgi:hypothetical protein
MVYTVLYTDYSTLEIHHRCEAHGINTQSGMCEEPLFFVNVRQKPNALSQETKSYIKNAVDYFLSPFCMSSRNLNFTGWSDTLPLCNPSPPADWLAAIQNVQRNLKSSRVTENSPQSGGRGKCGVPLVPRGINIDVSRVRPSKVYTKLMGLYFFICFLIERSL